MPLLSDTIEAALIAGGVSFLGLLIAKQSKVSEFRQAWIDALREEVATLVSHAFTIFESDGTDKEQLDVSFAELHKVTALISLRLNPKEKESQALIAAMGALRDVIHTETNFVDVSSKVNALTSATQVVLKNEWRRVKTGELFYRWVFRSAILGTMALIVIILIRRL